MHDQECAARVLGLPEGHTVPIVLAFGYLPAGRQARRPRPPSTAACRLSAAGGRTPIGELVHEERW